MEHIPCNSNGPAQIHDGFATVEKAVAALTCTNLNRLAGIAGRRLDRLAAGPTGRRLRSTFESLDMVVEAIASVLQGSGSPGQGRKTHPRHLASPQAFFNFLQAVVQSKISSELKSVSRQGEHVTWDRLDGGPASATDVVREVAQRETLNELFHRLKEQALNQPDLLAAIQGWEADADQKDQIPKGALNDKTVHTIRLRARQVLRNMAKRDGIEQATGRELLIS